MRSLLLSVLAGLISIAVPLRAAELPGAVIPNGVGVNIHFTTGHEADLNKIQAAGFKFIRMDFGWGGSERKKGEYDWHDYDVLTDNLEKRGIRPYYIFDYSNVLYEDSVLEGKGAQAWRNPSSPQHPESVAAFARWAAAAAKHFKGRHVIWEIWNEPNIGFWKPKPNAQQYATLALATAKAVREADPTATIVGPASSEFPWDFLEVVLSSGVLQYLDAVSVHPYRGGPPETAAKDFLKLHGLIAKHAPAGKKTMPILSGEWGYSTNDKGVPLETQAAYLARQQLNNLFAGVPVSIWYDWKNDGNDPHENEHNFGTVLPNLQPKPSYEAAQTLTVQLSGYRIARRLETGSDRDYALLCVHGTGSQKIVVWTMDASHAVSIDVGAVPDGAVPAVSFRGAPTKAEVRGGKLLVEATAGPTYVTVPKASDALAAAAAWKVAAVDGVSVKASSTGGWSTSVGLINPFSRPVQAQISWSSESGDPLGKRELLIKGNGQLVEPFVVPVHRRDAETGSVIVRVELSETGGQLIGRSSERLAYVLENPLQLVLAPIENGRQVSLSNPGGGAFAGEVRLGGLRYPFNLSAGQSHFVVALPVTLSSVTAQVYDAQGNLVVESPEANFHPVKFAAMRADVDGDAKIPAKAGLIEVTAPVPDAPQAKAFKLDYAFEKGWRFLRCSPVSAQPVPLSGRPKALGFWVYGDNSNNSLRLRVIDMTGQTFQYTGPSVNWTGWRWATIDFVQGAHWGGANDGTVHWPLRWDCPLLLDGMQNKTGGTLYFTGFYLVY